MLQLFASTFADFRFQCIFTGIKFFCLLKLNIYFLVARVTNQLSVITNNQFLLREMLQHVLQIAETF